MAILKNWKVWLIVVIAVAITYYVTKPQTEATETKEVAKP